MEVYDDLFRLRRILLGNLGESIGAGGMVRAGECRFELRLVPG